MTKKIKELDIERKVIRHVQLSDTRVGRERKVDMQETKRKKMEEREMERK